MLEIEIYVVEVDVLFVGVGEVGIFMVLVVIVNVFYVFMGKCLRYMFFILDWVSLVFGV